MRLIIACLVGVLLLGGWAWAAPLITASCPMHACVVTERVISLAAGTTVTFQVADPQTAPREVIWTFGDGAKEYGYIVQHRFLVPGKYIVEALVIYDTQTLPQIVQVEVHVVAALPVEKRELWGLPTEIVYPVLSALAVVIVYWLTGTVPG